MKKIFTDGAATLKEINGEYVRENGGWAFADIGENNKIIFESNGGEMNTSNNRMELTAILNALNYSNEAEIISDSAYCVNMLKENGWIYSWAKNGWTRGKKHEPIENIDIIKQIWGKLQTGNYIFTKVKGHSDNEWNNYVDRLAVKAKESIKE